MALVSNKMINNLAFSGTLMHLGVDTVNATAQVLTKQLFFKKNAATVGAAF